MTSDQDRLALSQLALGDLSPADARDLRRRIEEEPDLAATWKLMCDLPTALQDLGAEPPPRALVEAVVGIPAKATRRWVTPAVGVLALAAGVLIGTWVQAPSPVSVNVTAGEVSIAVAGEAEISWEPVEDGWRVTPRSPGTQGQGEDMTKIFVGVGIGAVVSVAVIQGRALISGPGGDSTVEAGQHTSVSVPLQASQRIREDRTIDPSLGPAVGTNGAPTVAQLKKENEALAFENAVLRGQLEGTQGVPSQWPDDVPMAFREEAVSRALETAFGDFGELAVLDCDEYPCVAFVDVDPGAFPEMRDATKAVKGAYEAALGLSPEGFFVADVHNDDGKDLLLVGNPIVPPGEELSEAVMKRLEMRANTALHDLEQQMSEP